MKKSELVKRLKESYLDIRFDYKDITTLIVCYGPGKYDVIMYNAEERITCDNLDELLKLQLYDGKTILDICEDITEFEYI